jgi:xanthine dehydrogenase accessory factor
LRLLHDQGVNDAQLARLHAPAGLDLGPVANAEIAVAILADLVARHASGELRGATPTTARREAGDPVCGMVVYVDDAKHHAVLDGSDYWFCSAGCLRAFEHDPTPFAG